MGVGLQPLEFSECLADSPQFRENLQRHEKELERTSQQIKRLIKEVKDVVSAARRLSAAQLALASSMEQLEFASIGSSVTEDERVVSAALSHFAALLRNIEDERDRMLSRTHEQIIQPLERFRKEHIGAVKEGKKKFDKKTAKFCQTQERTLALSTKKPDIVFQEADAALEMAARDFCAASVEYAFQLQAVQERKKFELVETLLSFVYSWFTFHHAAHDLRDDAQPLVDDLQLRIQRTRTNFEETSKQAETLMKKMMDMRQMKKDMVNGEENGSVTIAGYLFLMEKKAFGTTWTKQYCTFERDSGTLSLTPYNQINVKAGGVVSDRVVVRGARAGSEAAGAAGGDRRFLWEALPADAERPPLPLQAASAAARDAWLHALNRHAHPHNVNNKAECSEAESGFALDEAGLNFVTRLIHEIEARGLHEQGLYRVAGVSSKVSRLLSYARAGSGGLPPSLNEWETRTLTSALKAYLRALPEPLLPKHAVQAAKCADRAERDALLCCAVRGLSGRALAALRAVVRHLRAVRGAAALNLMSSSNLAVVFGPTLLHAHTDTIADILQLKFYNVCVEALIDHPTLFRDSDERTSPLCSSMAVATRNDMSVLERVPPAAAAGPAGGRYSPHHHHLLQQLAPARAPHNLGAVCAPRSSSGSAESVSSGAVVGVGRRVRTLYACLGECEGELSFEPNQIITDVAPSGEPGWLRGTLAGRTGLVPHNYVEPLP